MEGEEKSKKVTKEKRSIKKSKTVALPVKEIPVKEIPAAPVAKPVPTTVTASAPAPVVKAKSAAKEPAKKVARPKKVKDPTFEEIQLQAYFIGERRKKFGIPGDETSDWVEAELTLRAQIASK
jgi:hypothetical protein